MNQDTIFGVGGMVFVLVLIVPVAVVLIWQGFKTWQIRIASNAESVRTAQFRKLAEEAVNVQHTTADNQLKIVKDLSEMKERLYNIEKMLREVE